MTQYERMKNLSQTAPDTLVANMLRPVFLETEFFREPWCVENAEVYLQLVERPNGKPAIRLDIFTTRCGHFRIYIPESTYRTALWPELASIQSLLTEHEWNVHTGETSNDD